MLMHRRALGPRMRRPGAHPLVRGDYLFAGDVLSSTGRGAAVAIRQRFGYAGGHFRLQSRLSAFELGQRASGDAGELGQLRLSQSCHNAEVSEVLLALRNGHQFGDGNSEGLGDAGEGVDAGGGGAAFPVVDRSGADVGQSGKFSGVEVPAGADGYQRRSIESSQDAAGHARPSALVLIADHCAIPLECCHKIE